MQYEKEILTIRGCSGLKVDAEKWKSGFGSMPLYVVENFRRIDSVKVIQAPVTRAGAPWGIKAKVMASHRQTDKNSLSIGGSIGSERLVCQSSRTPTYNGSVVFRLPQERR